MKSKAELLIGILYISIIIIVFLVVPIYLGSHVNEEFYLTIPILLPLGIVLIFIILEQLNFIDLEVFE